jgi:tetratricopeptide (TPR) repeat protein
MSYRLLFPAATLLLALGLTGCATTVNYIPTDDNAKMSLTKARRVLANNKVKIIDNQTLEIDRVLVEIWIGHSYKKLNYPLKDLKVSAGHESYMYHGWPALQLPGYSRVMINEPQLVAEAIYVVKRHAEKSGFKAPAKSEEAVFDEAAAAYLAAEAKPELDSDTRRLKVQAEDALREKRFEDVADIYGEALAIAPWWPAGHYNRALVLSELKEYPGAIAEMKRYLRLAPNADNAVAAQDAIYKWEAKVRE